MMEIQNLVREAQHLPPHVIQAQAAAAQAQAQQGEAAACLGLACAPL